jgi:hypothetical protein
VSADLQQQVLAFIRRVAPFGYCDDCLAKQLHATLEEITAALAALALPRRRRWCYGCRRTVEVAEVGEQAGK